MQSLETLPLRKRVSWREGGHPCSDYAFNASSTQAKNTTAHWDLATSQFRKTFGDSNIILVNNSYSRI